MVRLLERSIKSVDERLVLLAPSTVPSCFKNVDINPRRHEALSRAMQRLRGSVYLRDGAIKHRELSADGRHVTPEDDRSWHVLLLDRDGRLNSCIWYLEHENSVGVHQLRARGCSLNRDAESRAKFRSAIEAELALARQEGVGYAESGGWAVAEGSRCSTEGLVLALAAFSMGNLRGGVLALATATARHCSAEILRRLGGAPVSFNGAEIPPYFDTGYNCEMELLRFDSRRPNPKYAAAIELLCEKLTDAAVIGRTEAVETEPFVAITEPVRTLQPLAFAS